MLKTSEQTREGGDSSMSVADRHGITFSPKKRSSHGLNPRQTSTSLDCLRYDRLYHIESSAMISLTSTHQGMPTLPRAVTPLASIDNALSYFSNLQLPPGNWGCEYGGPLFLLPGLVITWYVTNTPVPDHISIEIRRYLFARQNLADGGWGLHIEGESSVFGTTMNYVVLRLLGASEEDRRLVKARNKLHELGGAVNGPHWAKFWLSVLGCMEWDAVNPVPPELW